MAHRVEEAPSGRARCRGCKQKIDKGALRLSVGVPNPFGEGESHHHYHLACGALRQPEALLELARGLAPAGAAASPDTLPDADPPGLAEKHRTAVLEQVAAAQLSEQHRRLRRFVRAERASTGRALCRHCREAIAKGEIRLVLEIVDEGMANAAGFVHVGCAASYVGTTEYLVQLIRAQTTESIDWAELSTQLGAGGGPSA